MEPIRIEEIVLVTGGTLLQGDKDAVVTSVSINSKEVEPGALFVPIIGERVDAHRFISGAKELGAVATFTSRQEEKLEDGLVYIQVEDTLKALQQLATAYRNRFSIPIIGITGSVGKTTTKEMVSAVLESEKKVVKTIGNRNSQIGLSLMMFELDSDTEIAVIEMGMSEEGEMARLADIARPEAAVMTNIGVSHIEQLGSQENIRKEKLNIINHFNKECESVLYLCNDDRLLCEIPGWKENIIPVSEKTANALEDTSFVTYGATGTADDYCAVDIRMEGEHTCFRLVSEEGEEEIVLSVPGEHNVKNALAAIAIGKRYGISMEHAKEALKAYHPIDKRGVIYDAAGVRIIDDTYNASPDSMKSGIDILLELPTKGRRFAVLADVLELGEISYRCHYEVGQYISRTEKSGKRTDEVVTIGTHARAIMDAVEKENQAIRVLHCTDNKTAIEYLKETLQKGDTVLIKGSRGMHTEEIVTALREAAEQEE